MYLEGLKEFPKTDIKLKTDKGTAFHVKTDVFRKTMWYSYPGESELYSLTPERVKEIIEINKAGKLPNNLADFEIQKESVKEEVGYSNVVGQDSVSRFENKFKKNKKRKKYKGKKPNNTK